MGKQKAREKQNVTKVGSLEPSHMRHLQLFEQQMQAKREAREHVTWSTLFSVRNAC
uniref:3-oxoacyl-acyl-carrier-protein synthase III n=1 Tax=Rhizophora mucronata TaxID=61149 RepID=A0A2P2N0V8_RHIMU